MANFWKLQLFAPNAFQWLFSSFQQLEPLLQPFLSIFKGRESIERGGKWIYKEKSLNLGEILNIQEKREKFEYKFQWAFKSKLLQHLKHLLQHQRRKSSSFKNQPCNIFIKLKEFSFVFIIMLKLYTLYFVFLSSFFGGRNLGWRFVQA